MLPTNGSVSLGRPTTSSRSHGTLAFELNTDSIGQPSGSGRSRRSRQSSIVAGKGQDFGLRWPGGAPV